MKHEYIFTAQKISILHTQVLFVCVYVSLFMFSFVHKFVFACVCVFCYFKDPSLCQLCKGMWAINEVNMYH